MCGDTARTHAAGSGTTCSTHSPRNAATNGYVHDHRNGSPRPVHAPAKCLAATVTAAAPTSSRNTSRLHASTAPNASGANASMTYSSPSATTSNVTHRRDPSGPSSSTSGRRWW